MGLTLTDGMVYNAIREHCGVKDDIVTRTKNRTIEVSRILRHTFIKQMWIDALKTLFQSTLYQTDLACVPKSPVVPKIKENV